MGPIAITDLKNLGDDDKEEWERKTCIKFALANQFWQNKNRYFQESSWVSCRNKTMAHQVQD